MMSRFAAVVQGGHFAFGGAVLRSSNGRATKTALDKALLLVCLTIAHVMPATNIANAQSLDAAHAAYVEGRFLDAADVAESLGTSEALALAAKSITIHAFFVARESEQEALFARALSRAQAAVRSDPNNPEAHMQLAHVLGRHAQTIGILESASKGYAEKIRDAIKGALRLEPNLASAHLSMGMWHAEVVGSLGSFMADILYGADEDEALDHHERALQYAPDEKAAFLEYALSLLTLDGDDYRERIRNLLKLTIELPTKDAYDAILHRQAVVRLAALNERDD